MLRAKLALLAALVPGALFGADIKCNGINDDEAIRAGIQATRDAGGGYAQLPDGFCVVHQPVITVQYVRLRGRNTASTVIHAAPDFQGVGVVEVGDPANGYVAATAQSVEELAIECGDVARNGIYSNRMQEGAHIDDLLIAGCTEAGVRLEGGGNQNSYARGLYIFPSRLHPGARGVWMSNVLGRMHLDKVTVQGDGQAPQHAPGISLDGPLGSARITDVHCEGVTACVDVSAGASALVENAYGNWTMTGAVVHVAGDSAGVEARFVTGNGAVAVQDDIHSWTSGVRNLVLEYLAEGK